ncbi:MAG: aryl-sulfate sulfotransferase [Alphaproteobacteria bacterium]|nr:aryl-sulfate sulfotransferase [Alphaproteobacteria bacterium]
MVAAALVGCRGAVTPEVTAEPLESVTTVLEVRWDRIGDSVGWVELPDGTVAPDVGDDPVQHRVLVAGFPQLTNVSLLPVMTVDGQRIEGEPYTATTGVLPAGLPLFRYTTVAQQEVDPPFLLVTVIGQSSNALILNREGEIVWYSRLDANTDAAKAIWDPTYGEVAFLYNARDRTNDISSIRRVTLDGVAYPDIRAIRGHHALAQPEEGVFAFLSADIRDPDGEGDVIGDAIVEVDASGAEREVWTAWDEVPFEGRFDADAFYEVGYDWLHGNALNWMPERNSYLYSSRNLSTVYEIDRDTGEIIETFGGPGDRPFDPPDAAFMAQHSPSYTPEGHLLIFDSRLPDAPEEHARIAEYNVTPGRLEMVREFKALPGYHVMALGDADRLESGDTLSSWGTVGQLIQFNEEAEEIWRLSSDIGFVVGDVQGLPSLYPE